MTTPQHARSVQDLLDRAAITDVLYAYATGVDRRDWARYRAIFTDEVLFDFTTWGVPPTRVKADEWTEVVRGNLSCFDATQHTLTNPVITLDGDSAEVVAHMTAVHILVTDGVTETQTLGGFYRHRLERCGETWKISICTLTITWELGSRDLFDRAKARGIRARVDDGQLTDDLQTRLG